MVIRRDGCFDIAELAYIFQGDHLLAHDIFSHQILAWFGNPISDQWHLLTTNGPLIERSGGEIRDKVRNSDSNHDWQEYLNVIGCFHDDDCKRVSHARVASHEASAPNYDIIFIDCLYCVVITSNELGFVHGFEKDIAHGASDDHTWQEETSWHKCSVRGNREQVPSEEKEEHVPILYFDFLIHNVSDDVTLGRQEQTEVWVELAVAAPATVHSISLLRV